nr:ORF1 [Torque teno mini virus 12]
MPYYWRPWRRYHRRLWRRRTRAPFRKRLWRRRRRRRPRRVRKKLKKITVKQWQPDTIRRLKITGEFPLFEGTRERTTNNLTQYLESIAPYRVPGGGLWSINRFTLESLYGLHLKARNWWTQSNCSLPLIRLTGIKLKLHRSLNTDYIFVWANCGDLTATEKMYQSAQPSVLLLNRRKIIVTCDNGLRKKKPYKTVRIKPPAMWENKWYFQKDIANIPFLMTIAASASLDRYYLSSKSESNTIGFTSLNTEFFKNHNFKTPPPTTGYRPNDQWYLYTYQGNVTDPLKATYAQLIYLGNTKDWQAGTPIGLNKESATKYWDKLTNWGNPFYGTNFDTDRLLITNQDFQTIKTKHNFPTAQIEGFQTMTQPITWDCRYNPEADKSQNAVFITPITGATAIPWQEPHDQRLITQGLPLWLLLHGWTDYHAKAQDIQRLMTDNCIAIVSDYITPTHHTYYVPLDQDFLNGQSPYQKDYIKDYDKQNWHPKLNFQIRSLNEIVNSGPATPKLPPDTSTEAHMTYSFYFKLGGCPPPMDDVCDPATRGKYPTPNNLLSTTLLQDPQAPIEYYLSKFDERRGQLTEPAAKRIKKDFQSKETLFDFTGESSTAVPLRETETDTETSSEEEKDPEEIQLNIQRHRRKQRKLRKRLLQLLQLT